MGDRVAVLKDGILQQVDTPRNMYDAPEERLRRRLHRLARDEPARGRRRGQRHALRRRRPPDAARDRGRGRQGRAQADRRRPAGGHGHRGRGQGPQDDGQPRRGARRRRLRLRRGRGRRQAPTTSSPASTAAGRRRRARRSTSRPSRVTCTCSRRSRASACRPEVAAWPRPTARPGRVDVMALQILAAPGDPALLDLPWQTPLERVADRPARRATTWHLPPRGALRAPRRVGLRRQGGGRDPRPPRVRPAAPARAAGRALRRGGRRRARPRRHGRAAARPGAGHPAPAVLAALPRAVLPDAAPRHGRPADRRAVGAAGAAAQRPASTGATARLSNTLFRRDAGSFAAYLVDAETGELHTTLSAGQREYDLDLARTNIAGELLDLEAGGLLHPSIDPVDIADAGRRPLQRACGTSSPSTDVFDAARALPRRPAGPPAQRPRLRRRRALVRHRRRRPTRASSIPRSSTPVTTAAGCCA